MQEINLQNAFQNIPSDFSEACSMSEDEYEELVCAQENARKVEQKDPLADDCPICGNKGQIWRWDRELQMRVVSTCKCVYTGRALEVVNHAGVCVDWKKKTLDSFHASEQWQKSFKKNIVEYIAGGTGWLYVSGQSGCGKTHLCTAAFVELVSGGRRSGQYTTWLELMQKLDAAYYDSEAYSDTLKPLTTCTVLYLDDMFKARNNENISTREFSHTMRLIDARYQNPDNITLISSEWTMERLAAFDEALAGRIAERCGRHIVQIAKADGRNHRLYHT